MLESEQYSIKAGFHHSVRKSLADECLLLQKQHEQHVFQARVWFCLSVGGVVLGILMISVGVVGRLIGLAPSGLVETLMGTVPTFFSGLFLQQKKWYDRLLKGDLDRIHDIKEQERRFELILGADETLRDDFIRKYVGLPLKEESMANVMEVASVSKSIGS